MKQGIVRAVERLSSLGFALIIGSIIYFIIGSVASLVNGTMLEWTFCGSVRHLFAVDWCDISGTTRVAAINHFIHRLLNVTLPWFMMFWGFIIVGAASLLQRALGRPYPTFSNRNR